MEHPGPMRSWPSERQVGPARRHVAAAAAYGPVVLADLLANVGWVDPAVALVVAMMTGPALVLASRDRGWLLARFGEAFPLRESPVTLPEAASPDAVPCPWPMAIDRSDSRLR